MSLDKVTLDSPNTIFNTAFDKHHNEIKANITTQINTITKSNTESTEAIKQSISGLTQKITQNTESIIEVKNRVDTMENNFENKFESIQNRLTNLEQGTLTPEEHMINITKANTIKHEINEKTDITKSDITYVEMNQIEEYPMTKDSFI